MLLCVSASHKTAPFELLERLSTPASPVGPLIASHHECVQGAVVVATCNRFEAYIDMDDPVTAAEALGVEAALEAIAASTDVSSGDIEGSYEIISGPAVAEHLFSVASGLESVVVGEGEIAGQVRRSLTQARALGTTSPELERLFQRASEAQRDVKNSTALQRAGRSLVRLALDLADSRIVDWAQLNVLLVGTGSYAAATLAALRDHGAQNITVHSPSGRAEAFALKHGISAASAESYPHVAAYADLVVTCTSSENPVVDADLLRGTTLRTAAAEHAESESAGCPVAHPAGRRIVIDLGLPRNVHPNVADVTGIDLLDLETIRLHAPLEELNATDAARNVVRNAAARFGVVGERRSVTPAVVALRTHVFGLLESEITRAQSRGDDGRTEQALRHLVGVLLHTPTARAHAFAEAGRGEEFIAGLGALFGLELDEDVADDAADISPKDIPTGAGYGGAEESATA